MAKKHSLFTIMFDQLMVIKVMDFKIYERMLNGISSSNWMMHTAMKNVHNVPARSAANDSYTAAVAFHDPVSFAHVCFQGQKSTHLAPLCVRISFGVYLALEVGRADARDAAHLLAQHKYHSSNPPPPVSPKEPPPPPSHPLLSLPLGRSASEHHH